MCCLCSIQCSHLDFTVISCHGKPFTHLYCMLLVWLEHAWCCACKIRDVIWESRGATPVLNFVHDNECCLSVLFFACWLCWICCAEARDQCWVQRSDVEYKNKVASTSRMPKLFSYYYTRVLQCAVVGFLHNEGCGVQFSQANLPFSHYEKAMKSIEQHMHADDQDTGWTFDMAVIKTTIFTCWERCASHHGYASRTFVFLTVHTMKRQGASGLHPLPNSYPLEGEKSVHKTKQACTIYLACS